MNVAIKYGHVFVGRERIHHIGAIAGEPFPLGREVEQRAMSEHDDRRGCWKARQIGFLPRQLLGADRRPSRGDVVHRDEMHRDDRMNSRSGP